MTTATAKERLRFRVQGIVQGVGFRPFIYGQAVRNGLAGFVLNVSDGVTVEVEGDPGALERFRRALAEDAPQLARIDSITVEQCSPLGETDFTIAHSRAGSERSALVSPDTSTCDDCLREMFDPDDRRYGYAFINCTNCGPRFTIVQYVPYDRVLTTMRAFAMCPDCQAEYDDPLSRRFHAEPNACPKCGPRMRLLDAGGEEMEAADPVAEAACRLASGAILAIKGLGGYHLACDALNEEAVGRLRSRKHRDAKPFALMVRDIETARLLCEVSDAEAALLKSRRRPIVLLKSRPDAHVASAVAPGYPTLGIMLPYTPLHHILLRAFAKSDERGLVVLVMTSANLSEEPIAYEDADARERLSGIIDGMLTHNRDIHVRCDDSVVRVAAGGEQIFRRSRGYAPEPVRLALETPVPVLACGGHLKNTFCLLKGRQAFLSQHIGDLENMETLTSFRKGIWHFKRLFDIEPQAVAYDLHPEYLATKYALDLSPETGQPRRIGVQHHHAHVASVIAEHGLQGEVIGVAADGTGYGTDGAIWGCEIMLADLIEFERLAHLAYVPLPGGEQAVRQPWRMGAVYLSQAFGADFLDLDIPFVRGLDRELCRALAQMAARGINSPDASSLGRLFDAVAALLCIRGKVVYEGQAAIELEMLAEPSNYSYPFSADGYELDVRPVVRGIVEDLMKGVPVARIAGRFHRTIAEMLAVACLKAREVTGVNRVALSGGVFQNRLLLEQLVERLGEDNFAVYTNRRVPPNDGGLSLGQAAVAAALLAG
jgi:hydrogenase maturation protein HypF